MYPRENKTAPDAIVRRRSLAALAVLLCLPLGCTSFQSAVNGLSHWQENRVDCPENDPACGNNNCVDPCVTLDKPHGYLASGSTFGGAAIVGAPGPSALDRVLELEAEVESLKRDKADLEQQLGLAEETIKTQATAIDSASQELQQALTDYNRLRDQLANWQEELRRLDEMARHERFERDRELHQFELELEQILATCSLRAQSAESSQPANSEDARDGAEPLDSEEDVEGEPSQVEPSTRPSDEETPITRWTPPAARDSLPAAPVIHLRANLVSELSTEAAPKPAPEERADVSLVPPNNHPIQ